MNQTNNTKVANIVIDEPVFMLAKFANNFTLNGVNTKYYTSLITIKGTMFIELNLN